MNKRTLVLVVAVLGLLTVLASGRMNKLRLGEGSGVGLMMNRDMVTSVEKVPAIEPGMMGKIAFPYPGSAGDALQVEDRALEYSAYHDVVVDDVPEYMQRMREYILSINGRVLHWNQGKHSLERYRYGTITAKVPVTSFEETVSRVTSGVEEVVSENQNIADITGEVVYSQEQTESIRGEIAVQEAALSEATTEVERVRIRNRLDSLRKQLEQAENQGEQIEERQEFATISITVADSESYFNGSYKPSLFEELRQAMESLRYSLSGVLVVIIWVAVYSVIWLPLVLGVNYVTKFFKRKAK